MLYAIGALLIGAAIGVAGKLIGMSIELTAICGFLAVALGGGYVLFAVPHEKMKIAQGVMFYIAIFTFVGLLLAHSVFTPSVY